MEFRLTLETRLRASNTGDRSETPARKDYRHHLRQVFHPQMKRLWEQTPFLSTGQRSGPATFLTEDSEQIDYRASTLAKKHTVGGYPFVPLVSSQLNLLCGLDILFLRRDPPGGLIHHGDIDNRLKTLFDVLSMPDANQGYEARPHRPSPLYVLLENDRLITKVTVETDSLLQDIDWSWDKEKDRENDARLVITVRLRPAEMTLGNMQFG